MLRCTGAYLYDKIVQKRVTIILEHSNINKKSN